MPIGAGSAQRRLAEGLLAAALLAIALLTLGPGPAAELRAGPRIVVVGSLADVLRNVALYLPLGAALALRGAGARYAWLAGLALSAAIETSQLAVPGRTCSPADVLANTLGAGVGHWLVRSAPRWLAPARGLARRLEGLALAVWLASALASAVLTAPAFTPGPWYAHWNPTIGTLVPYRGPVREAMLDGQALVHGRIGDPAAARAALGAGDPLRLRVDSAGPTAELESIFLISDARDRELALLALEGEDLVYRYRSRARALSLEPAILRQRGAWRGAGATAPVALGVWREGTVTCLARDAAVRCGLGFGVGSAWTLLLPVLAFPPGAAGLFDALWLAGLAVPLGLWWRAGGASWGVLALAAAPLALLPACGWLLSTSTWQWLAAAGGWLVGRLLAHALARRRVAG